MAASSWLSRPALKLAWYYASGSVPNGAVLDRFLICAEVAEHKLPPQPQPAVTERIRTLAAEIFPTVITEMALLLDPGKLVQFYLVERTREVAAEKQLVFDIGPADADGDIQLTLTDQKQKSPPQPTTRKQRFAAAFAQSVHNLSIGSSLIDMHDFHGLQEQVGIKEPHEIIEHIRIQAEGGCAFIRKIFKLRGYDGVYTNKMLVIVAEPEDLSDGEGGKYVLRAAYSYDDREFGLMKIEVREEPASS